MMSINVNGDAVKLCMVAIPEECKRRNSCQQFIDDISMDIGQPVVAALELVGQLQVIDSQQMQ
jgi:hypothetical protein